MPAPSARQTRANFKRNNPGHKLGLKGRGYLMATLAIASIVAVGQAPLTAAAKSLGKSPQATAKKSASKVTKSASASKSSVSKSSTPATVPSPDRISCASVAEVEKRSMRWRMANLVVVGIKNTELTRATALVTTQGIGGILIRGLPTQADRAALIALRDARTDMPTFVAVDEEGGRVQHLKKAIGVLASAHTLAASSSEAIEAITKVHAGKMKALGFTVDFGPVVDLYADTENGLGDRASSADPAEAARYGAAFARGMLAGGIYPVLKHFPGGGHADGDPHYKGTVSPPWNVVETTDLVPFKTILSELPIGVMVGHQRLPGLEELPASLSPKAVTGILRTQMNFQGLAVTDSLSMWAINYNFKQPEAAVRALRAGNDVLLFDDEPNVEAIISTLTESGSADPAFARRATESNLRILVAKGVGLCPGTALPLSPA
jgi:beta-N-acetylhexosaminidase